MFGCLIYFLQEYYDLIFDSPEIVENVLKEGYDTD